MTFDGPFARHLHGQTFRHPLRYLTRPYDVSGESQPVAGPNTENRCPSRTIHVIVMDGRRPFSARMKRQPISIKINARAFTSSGSRHSHGTRAPTTPLTCRARFPIVTRTCIAVRIGLGSNTSPSLFVFSDRFDILRTVWTDPLFRTRFRGNSLISKDDVGKHRSDRPTYAGQFVLPCSATFPKVRVLFGRYSVKS